MRMLVLLSIVVAACGGGTVDADPFDTLQACFDEHAKTEGLTVPHALTVCCLDHPIGGMAAGIVCGTTEAMCETTVNAAIADADATPADITAACTDYINQR